MAFLKFEIKTKAPFYWLIIADKHEKPVLVKHNEGVISKTLPPGTYRAHLNLLAGPSTTAEMTLAVGDRAPEKFITGKVTEAEWPTTLSRAFEVFAERADANA